MKKPKHLVIKIDDPEIIQAFEDVAEARNIRETNEDYRINWTAQKVALVWLDVIGRAINRCPNISDGGLRDTYLSYDWKDVDAIREKRKLSEVEK